MLTSNLSRSILATDMARGVPDTRQSRERDGARARGSIPAIAAALLMLLLVPAAAHAATPDVKAFSALSTGPTAATISGIVKPEGEAIEYFVAYGLATSGWCEKGTGQPERTTSPRPLSASVSFEFVEVELSALKAGSDYCAALAGASTAGTIDGERVTFVAGAPSSYTEEVLPTSTTTAVVYGEVDPAAQSTEYEVAYGLASSEWCKSRFESGTPQATAPLTLGGTGASYEAIEVELRSLEPKREYCAALRATNGSGTAQLEAGEPLMFTSGAPSVFSAFARSTGETTALIEASIDPASQASEYRLEYAPEKTFEWCRTEAKAGTPSSPLPFQSLGYIGPLSHETSIALSGLAPGTLYCMRIVVRNGTATAYGPSLGRRANPGASRGLRRSPPPTLTVTIAGNGSGTFTGSGISCPGTCSQSYANGTVIRLLATPAPGSKFTGWNACAGTGTCGGALTASRTIVATFTADVPPRRRRDGDGYALSVWIDACREGCGGTSVKLKCTGSATCVGTLTLTAKAVTKGRRKSTAKTVTLATASFSILAGQTESVAFKLNASGRKQLSAAHGHLNATLSVEKSSPEPSSTLIDFVHLAMQKPEHRGK